LKKKDFRAVYFKSLILFVFFFSALFASGCGCGSNKHYTRGRELYRNKDLNGAIEELQAAHKQQPKNVEIISFLGKVYFENKNFEQSAEMYEKELQLVPSDIQAHFNLAKAYKEKGDGALAVEHFNKVVEINPRGKLAKEAEKLIPECSSVKPSQPPKQGAAQTSAGAADKPVNRTDGSKTAKKRAIDF